MSDNARKIMLAICLAMVAVVVWANVFFQPEEPAYVKLQEFEYRFMPSGSTLASGHVSELRMVSFHYDVADSLESGVIKRSNRVDYIVEDHDVNALVSVKEKDPETGERNLRLHRVRVSKPYMSSPELNDGVPVLSWQVISVWATPGG